MRTRGHDARQRRRPERTTEPAPFVIRSADEDDQDEVRFWTATPKAWLIQLYVDSLDAIVTVLEKTDSLDSYLADVAQHWATKIDWPPLQWKAEALGYATLTATPLDCEYIRLDVQLEHAAHKWAAFASLLVEGDQLGRLARQARDAPAIV